MVYYPNYPTYTPPYQRQEQAGLNWVQGETGAKSWFVAPGATVLLMDSEKQRFYVKSADMNGMPMMRTYEYTEVGAPPTQTANFVTVDEFNTFKNEVLNRLETPRKKKGADYEQSPL